MKSSVLYLVFRFRIFGLFHWTLSSYRELQRNLCPVIEKVLVRNQIKAETTSLGWMPRFSGFLNSANKIWIWIAQIVERKKSFPMIMNSNQFPGNWTSKIHFFYFCVGVWVGGFLPFTMDLKKNQYSSKISETIKCPR